MVDELPNNFIMLHGCVCVAHEKEVGGGVVVPGCDG